MTVRRRVRIARHWVPPGTWGLGSGQSKFTWEKLVQEFKGSGIDFDSSAAVRPATMDRAAFTRILMQEVAKKSAAEQAVFSPQDEQFQRGYAIKLRTYAELGAIALGKYKTHFSNDKKTNPERVARLVAFLRTCAELKGDPTIVRDVVPLLGAIPWGSWKMAMQILDTVTHPAFRAQAVDTSLNACKTDEEIKQKLVQSIHGYADETAYLTVCKDLTRDLLFSVCGLFIQEQAADERGLHVFQFDFENNFDMFSASGWGFETPSNRTQCPECESALSVPNKASRKCGTCNAVLRDEASLMTLVPLSLVRPLTLHDVVSNMKGLYGLVQNPDNPKNEAIAKRFTLESMPGVRAEVLVAHEMGHQLFLPHSPSGFDSRDIDQTVEMGMAQKAILGKFLDALRTTPALLNKLQDATDPAGANVDFHDADHRACMMGYNFAALAHMHFCTKCVLRMRGWKGDSVEALP